MPAETTSQFVVSADAQRQHTETADVADERAISAASGQPAGDLAMGLEGTLDAAVPLPRLPDDLAQGLAQILADALHDDLTQYPKLSEIPHPKLSEIPQRLEFTVASPSGTVRKRQRRAGRRPSESPTRRLPRRGTSRAPSLLKRDAPSRVVSSSAREVDVEPVGGAEGNAYGKIDPPAPRKNTRGPPTSQWTQR